MLFTVLPFLHALAMQSSGSSYGSPANTNVKFMRSDDGGIIAASAGEATSPSALAKTDPGLLSKKDPVGR
jgi:hypothetical protein